MVKLKDACCAPYKMTAEDRKREERWRAEADLDTLITAARIRKDKARLSKAMAIAKEKKSELAAVTPKELKSKA